MIYNLLNFPTGVVTVSTVTADDEEELRHYNGTYQDRLDKLFKEVRNVPVSGACCQMPDLKQICFESFYFIFSGSYVFFKPRGSERWHLRLFFLSSPQPQGLICVAAFVILIDKKTNPFSSK